MTVATNTRVLIVGAFPRTKAQPIYGGQVAACMRLLDSSFVATHDVRTLDTTQISNPPPSFAVRLLLAAKRLVQFQWKLLFHKPQVVILFFADGASACEKGLMVWLARFLGIRVMVFPRAGSLIQSYATKPAFAAFMRHTLRCANMFLCQGRAFQNFAIEQLGFTRETAPIIPNWTAREEHLAIGAVRNYGQDSDRVNILFLGWLEAFKGVFDLLEAARMLHEQGAMFHLTLAGNGHALSEAKRFVEQHDLGNSITFAGWVDEEAKAALLQASDLFVLPSWSEGLPNAMIEAMSAGLACVLTDVGTIRNYVTHEKEALMVEPCQPAALAGTLKRLILDYSLRSALGKNGYRLALVQFSLEQGAKRLSEAVFQLTSSH